MMIKTPICEVCLKSEVLCSGCDSKLKNQEITDLDISISKYLYKLEQSLIVSEANFIKSHDLEDFILLLAKGNIAPLIGKEGKTIKMISKKFGKRVRIISEGDMKTMAQDLVSPARIFGINVLYTPMGEEYNIVIPKSDRRKIIMSDRTLKKALSVLFNNKLNIKFS